MEPPQATANSTSASVVQGSLRLMFDRPAPAAQLTGRSPLTLDQSRAEVVQAEQTGAHGLRDPGLFFNLVTRYQIKWLHSVTRYRIMIAHQTRRRSLE